MFYKTVKKYEQRVKNNIVFTMHAITKMSSRLIYIMHWNKYINTCAHLKYLDIIWI